MITTQIMFVRKLCFVSLEYLQVVHNQCSNWGLEIWFGIEFVSGKTSDWWNPNCIEGRQLAFDIFDSFLYWSHNEINLKKNCFWLLLWLYGRNFLSGKYALSVSLFCQFSMWPRVKMSYLRAEQKAPSWQVHLGE